MARPSDPVGPPGPVPRSPSSVRNAPRELGAGPLEAVGRIGVGSVLGRSFSVYGRNLTSFGLISLVVYAPLIAYAAYVLFSAPGLEEVETWDRVNGLASLLLPNVLAGPLTYGVVEQLRGRQPAIGTCFRVGFARVPRVVLTGLLVGLIVAGILVAVLIPLAIALAVFGGRPGDVANLTYLILGGMVLLSCRYWVAVPAAVVEDVGPAEAVKRSVVLTRGNIWRIFAVVAVFACVDVGLQQVVERLSAGDVISPAAGAMGQLLLTSLFAGPLGAIACAIAYHDLRVTREGVDTEELARVFE